MSGTNEDKPPKAKKDTQEFYKNLFEKCDKNKSGFCQLEELKDVLKNESDDEILKQILNDFKRADHDHDGKLNYHEFMGMIQNKKFKALFSDYVNAYVNLMSPRQRQLPLIPDGLSRTYDEIAGVYEEQYTCCPPPFAMIFITIIQLVCFFVDEQTKENSAIIGMMGDIFICDPYKKFEFWRFLTYMFVHAGNMHLFMNLGIQLLLGVPLEMIHKWWRVLLVYLAGVLAGSLMHSVINPTYYLAGASSGVYALLTAHIGTIITNWNTMAYPVGQLLIFVIILAIDLGMLIFNQYNDGSFIIGMFETHIAGAVTGLLVGIWILRNFIPTNKEKYLWWSALIVYVVLMGILIILNMFNIEFI